MLLNFHRAMARAKVKLVDRQLACMPIGSPEGQDYLGAMQAAANFAFGNRWVCGHGRFLRCCCCCCWCW